MHAPISLSSSATRERWEIPVLLADDALLALDKPAGVLTSPDRYDPDRPNLITMLHAGIAEAKPWVAAHGLTYLMNPIQLDFETTGVLLLAKTKPVLVKLTNMFGSEKIGRTYWALVQGVPKQETFEVDAAVGTDPNRLGRMRVTTARGKKARTSFKVLQRFRSYCLLECNPFTNRTHQIRVHLKHAGHPLCGDRLYGGKPLLLSRLKQEYRFKTDREERPLMGRAALHAARLELLHPVAGTPLTLESPCPKDLTVALKYLSRYGA